MTPKEKARKLFDRYATYVVMWAGDANTSHQNCKQCALIAVDEIIDSIINTNTNYGSSWCYWQEVRKEIEAL